MAMPSCRKGVLDVKNGGFRNTCNFTDNISSRDLFLESRGMNYIRQGNISPIFPLDTNIYKVFY
jgi:hypothetical protein